MAVEVCRGGCTEVLSMWSGTLCTLSHGHVVRKRIGTHCRHGARPQSARLCQVRDAHLRRLFTRRPRNAIQRA